MPDSGTKKMSIELHPCQRATHRRLGRWRNSLGLECLEKLPQRELYQREGDLAKDCRAEPPVQPRDEPLVLEGGPDDLQAGTSSRVGLSPLKQRCN